LPAGLQLAGDRGPIIQRFSCILIVIRDAATPLRPMAPNHRLRRTLAADRSSNLPVLRYSSTPVSVDYRLEQISSSRIGQQALPQALCFGQ
jgi:hypothetical protein